MMAYHTGRRINPDMAAVNVQNRIAQAQGLLPAEVVQSSGVNVRKVWQTEICSSAQSHY